MKTVFPVELTILNEHGEKVSRHLLQGFTRDVSLGGICIELKSFGKETERDLSIPGASLDLLINPPFTLHPIQARASVVWMKKAQEIPPIRYIIGAAYTQIEPKAQRRIAAYAQRLIWIPRVSMVLGIGLLMLAANLFLSEQKLLHENKKLVNQLIQNAEKKSDVASKLVEIKNAKLQLSGGLDQAHRKIKELESKLSAAETESAEALQAYQKELAANFDKQKDLSERLKSVESGQAVLETAYQDIQKSERLTASAALHKMYEWLQSHRNLKTGLVASFEGDPALENVAFTYDLSLAAQTFLLFGDIRDAAEILTFFDVRAEREEGAFLNAYSTRDGAPVESLIHTGPNVWVGIAALQYEYRVKDGKYIELARTIGDWLIAQQDKEGGVKGGPHFNWYSTEHNLDAYAFFGMLYRITQDQKYKDAQDKTFSWIRKYAYSLTERRMNRGKGDATIATDTFSWAVAAIGPEKLKASDFDPEAIMEFAEEHCKVTISYKQPGGKPAQAVGFDFAKAQNVGRGGIISCEWTAQVVVTYQVLARYFESLGNREKANFYRDKANYYLSELQKLIITSPSRIGKGRGCLPYASIDNAETGHGWRTPKGIRTGSVAGTAYGIFAWTGFNPFDLDNTVEIERNN